ncbi:hypothetical protein, partial [Pseudomonas viridiflava]
MRKELDAFLWRSCNKATLDSLLDVSRGQYDVRLTKRDYERFFRGLSPHAPTALDGYNITVALQPFSGINPVGEAQIVVRYLGPKSSRKDWIISSQRPDSAYELWRENRGFVSRQSVGEKDFIVIARDVDNGFHGRWIRSEDFNTLPDVMRQPMNSSE